MPSFYELLIRWENLHVLMICLQIHKGSIKISNLVCVSFCLKECKDGAHVLVDSVVEWLKHHACDQHDLGSKPTRVILLCPWERYFTALSPA